MAAGQIERRLDLSSAPAIHILPTHLPTEDLHEYEDQVFAAHGKLTYDAKEARVFLARISQKKRAAFELRSKGIWTDEDTERARVGDDDDGRRKRRRTDPLPPNHNDDDVWPDLTCRVLVIKIEWLDLCVQEKGVVDYRPHLVYAAKVTPKETPAVSPKASTITYIKATPRPAISTASPGAGGGRGYLNTSAVSRAHRRLLGSSHQSHTSGRHSSSSSNTTSKIGQSRLPSPPKAANRIPPLPSWATGPYAIYSCCRSTPMESPNKSFVAELAKIKQIRILTLDSVGVRAYSTAIASISAYGYRIKHWTEIVRLPGCNERIAQLWQEWHDSVASSSSSSSPSSSSSTVVEKKGFIPEVRRQEADTDLQVLQTLYQIWGVGADTARRFYFKQGWKDMDDIVEYGWHSLSRVQQIGVKYYDEFQIPVGRAESESIAATIQKHARLALNIDAQDFNTEADIQVILVGGYRRGKTASGDVDVILSHRDDSLTKNLIITIVRALEDAAFITHTLVLHTAATDRDRDRDLRNPFPFLGGHNANSGFDSLDKALCVWQDPSSSQAPNPNLHRRVDIIISPWSTVGCAVLGWTGGTTFQRDIRRFAKKEKGWKFDSSGVRELGGGTSATRTSSGVIVDLERPRSMPKSQDNDDKNGWEWKDDWQSRERRVMEGLGIGWRPPQERCTG